MWNFDGMWFGCDAEAAVRVAAQGFQVRLMDGAVIEHQFLMETPCTNRNPLISRKPDPQMPLPVLANTAPKQAEKRRKKSTRRARPVAKPAPYTPRYGGSIITMIVQHNPHRQSSPR
jgi:hypothetical protein